ncbi:HD family phosphohydrolase [Aegicerativicinus sediminis]|uniref:HD family phosphohydrolase n=1 Tax=Aegicerativicinus sediminis TaxID=2893202 RepID=UPI001E649589|nr:HDIG domain-containing metalloprotein [Aegicerativicinus sediminis]
MNQFVNRWYRNHTLLYKVLLFISTTFLIVYLFPKSGKFKYTFDKGRPWQSETLYAPFDFAIRKSASEIDAETLEIRENSTLYFETDTLVEDRVFRAYETKFSTTVLDTIPKSKTIYQLGMKLLEEIYQYGVVNENYNYPPEKQIIVLEGQKQIHATTYSELSKTENLRRRIEAAIEKAGYAAYKAEFVSLFFDVVKPNLKLNEALTEKIIQEQLNTISPNRGSIERETLIIAKGEIVDEAKFEVLKSLEAEYESQVWTSSNYNLVIAAYSLLVALALLMLLLFMRKYRTEVFQNNTKVTFIFFNVLLMVLLTTLVVNYNAKYVYVVPICVLPLVLKAFFDARLGLFTHVLTVMLLGFIVPNSSEYMFLQIIAGIVTILTVSELYKRANLFISVGQITLIYILAYFAFFVIHEGSITNMNYETFGMFILGGLATLFVQPLIYIYEKIFDLVSDVSLLELSDTNSKLLKELSNLAPGTFHHSLNVANLAEAAANEIGANAMLARVGALYHDIGKMENPTYFTENQLTGLNPHDELSPRESTDIIIGHVIDGVEIAKKYNLPDRIIDFIRSHHGTSLVYYFYIKEKEIDQFAKEEEFRYPGPKPFSRETALLMMCDSVEAASKSLREINSGKIDELVESVITRQMEDDQFINANINFKEIEVIKKVLKSKLANIFHLRVEYPE